jgi:alginate O-acetyltransferase complex protein AlgJ
MEAEFDPGSPSLLKYDAKVLRGKNGRLFLDNDANQVLKQFTGELLFTDRQLRDWQFVLENRSAWLGKLGIPYYFLVPPNAYSVYPEDLPDGIQAGPVRPIEQLMRHLDEGGSFARIIYPLEEILAAKPNPLLYPKTETHWSGQAAFAAYLRLASEIGSETAMHTVREEDIRWHESLWEGELGYKVEPKEKSVLLTPLVERPASDLEYDNRVINRGMTVIIECPEAPPTTCLVFGDSFAFAMLTLLGSSFRRLVLVILPTLDYEVVRQERPDVVISVLNERFLMTVPYDVGAPTARDLVEEKTEQGLLRETDIPYWRMKPQQVSMDSEAT